MASNFDLIDNELEAFKAQDLVNKTNNADDLAYLVVEDEHHPVARTAAAEKLLKMWKEGRQGGITLDHLAYVSDYADEPYKSEANQIIRSNI